MTAHAKAMRFDRLPKDYAGLVRLLPPRPIRDRVDLEDTTEVVDAMTGFELTRDQADYLDLMSDLIDRYESEHSGISESVSPLEALGFLLGANGMSASDLGRLLGERSLGPKILSGQRQLSKAHIRTLADRFSVSADLFLR